MTFIGAEAIVELEESQAEKKRVKKNYRHPELDERLREERTEREIQLMKKAGKYNVSVPEVVETSDHSFEMEKVDGKKLRDSLDKAKFTKLGEEVALLHDTGIIHGDLTTSNVIVSDDLKVIDFGLAFSSDRLEDKAVDIHLLKQVLESSHSQKADKLWDAFLQGYRSSDESGEVLEQLEEVEQRGRYK